MEDQNVNDVNAENTPGSQNEDAFKSIKGEMHRKFDKVSEQLAQQAEINRQLLEQVRAMSAPRSEPSQANSQAIDDSLLYSNPKKYRELMAEQIKSEVRQELSTVNAAQSRTQQTIQELVSDYPELGDSHSDMSKKTVEIYTKMTDAEKASPSGLKAAAFKAAVELDVKPRHKRPVEDFIDSSSRNSPQANRRQSKKLDPAVEEFARLIGVPNIDSPEVKERLRLRDQRDWKTPTTPISTKKRK